MSIYQRLTCRLCGGMVHEVLQLTPTPIANSFPDKPDSLAERIPLNLTQCANCGHVQTSHVVTAHSLYSDYRYATPEAVRPHLALTAQMLRAHYPQAKRVLEIGCNNGLNLEELTKVGFDSVGVDPAAVEAHNTVRDYFSPRVASWIGQFDIIVANNVFAHIDNLWEVFSAVDMCLSKNGVLVFEVQYLPDMVRKVGFDMIYHEHHDYHTLRALAIFVRRFGLTLTKWKRLLTHGGSIRVFCERMGQEASFPDEDIDWLAFFCDIEIARLETQGMLQAIDGPVILFGAAAKACTLLHHFGIADRFSCCVDDTPAKQGRYIAGTDIKIYPTSILEQSKSNHPLFLTAWNYETVIRGRYPDRRILTPWHPEPQRIAA